MTDVNNSIMKNPPMRTTKMNHVNAFAYPTAYAAGLSNSFHPSIVMPLSATNELRAESPKFKNPSYGSIPESQHHSFVPISLLRFL